MKTPSWLLGIAWLAVAIGCAGTRSESHLDDFTVRWLSPSEVGPSGTAPGAHHRLVAAHPDGSRDYALILARGDEVLTALADFARDEQVVAAHFAAIGGVRDPEVAWFDLARKQFKAMKLAEQVEVLALTGDIGVDDKGKAAVHAHIALGRSDGCAVGGHHIDAMVSPTLAVFVTTYPQPLPKKSDPDNGIQLFDLSAPQ